MTSVDDNLDTCDVTFNDMKTDISHVDLMRSRKVDVNYKVAASAIWKLLTEDTTSTKNPNQHRIAQVRRTFRFVAFSFEVLINIIYLSVLKLWMTLLATRESMYPTILHHLDSM